jgi:tetratricopeptide (TPR) repeat protein
VRIRRNPAENGEKEKARKCYERALALGPNLISNIDLASRFYRQIGELAESLKCSSRILELSPSYAQGILESYASSDFQPLDTLNYGLPPDPAVACSYFRILLQRSEPEQIQQGDRTESLLPGAATTGGEAKRRDKEKPAEIAHANSGAGVCNRQGVVRISAIHCWRIGQSQIPAVVYVRTCESRSDLPAMEGWGVGI